MKVVDEKTLRQMIRDNEDISNVDTSQITDMSDLFMNNHTITSWPNNFDTSNFDY